MMTPEQIAADKALCEAATPGPWNVDDPRDDDVQGRILYSSIQWTLCQFPRPSQQKSAEFIARSRTALPEYISEVERLTARVAELEQQYDDAIEWIKAEARDCECSDRILANIARGRVTR